MIKQKTFKYNLKIIKKIKISLEMFFNRLKRKRHETDNNRKFKKKIDLNFHNPNFKPKIFKKAQTYQKLSQNSQRQTNPKKKQ